MQVYLDSGFIMEKFSYLTHGLYFLTLIGNLISAEKKTDSPSRIVTFLL